MDYKLEYQIYYLPGDIITLKPMFDVHLGNIACDEKAFIQYMEPLDVNTYYIGGGDMLDSIITRDVKRYRKETDKTEGDDIVDQQVNRMADILEPYKNQIIGLGDGNHEDAITVHCGTNPSKRLANKLNVRFLGYSYMVDLTFRNKRNGHWHTLKIRGHHGWGGGSRTQGGDLTKFSKDLSYYDADLFLYGHVHRSVVDLFPRLGTDKGSLKARPKMLVLCGTFLKTLAEGTTPTYSEKAGYPPVAVGGMPIFIKPDKTGLTLSVETKCRLSS